ncbi:MAG: pyruvate dehydrogenase complex dihydrolipoamide acetyltransferase [Gemmatimonadetes bacterium]|nr:pyruvate dehydrogenase complex dihydrolipoamide acetyltransferase [Gemmatimonadota bacterium]|tara:strand:+ start:3321 stop:4559 length:1239 start_codon:yes stop_codon:yes gene_type:complete
MVTKVHMEALSPTMEEGQLVQWLKSEGEEVSSGDILAEIETDKATMELVARGDGILRKIFLDAGGVSAVGSVIAVIASADEDISGIEEGSDGDGAQQALPAELSPETIQEPEVETTSEVSATTQGTGSVKASPLARRLAAEMGVDLSAIKGSGPGGRVVKRDLEGATTASSTGAVTTMWASDENEYEDVPTSQMRKSIAKRLVTSIGPVPTFYLTVEVDMNRVIEARESMNTMLEDDGYRISVNDIVLKAVAAALRQHPNCNAQWHENFVRRFNAVHLGVAVAIDEGLITPVIRDAHAKGIMQIASEVRELAGRARTKKLMPDEYTGSTFSVSNLGMFGIQEFTAIINPPEAGILAVGSIEESAVVVNGEVKVCPRMRITMSCDHRVIDGAQGARFLATLKSMLEEPTAILL